MISVAIPMHHPTSAGIFLMLTLNTTVQHPRIFVRTTNREQACVKQCKDLNILMIVLFLISITFVILRSEKSESFLVSLNHESVRSTYAHWRNFSRWGRCKN